MGDVIPGQTDAVEHLKIAHIPRLLGYAVKGFGHFLEAGGDAVCIFILRAHVAAFHGGHQVRVLIKIPLHFLQGFLAFRLVHQGKAVIHQVFGLGDGRCPFVHKGKVIDNQGAVDLVSGFVYRRLNVAGIHVEFGETVVFDKTG